MGDLPRWKKYEVWSHCNGWPTQNGKNMKCGLIVMGDLPRWKKYEVWSHYNGWPTRMEKIWSVARWKKYDEVRSHCHGWPTRMEKMWKTVLLWWATYPDGKNVKCGLIVMGDLSRWKKMWKTVLLWWTTYPDGKNVIWQVWKIRLTWRSPEGMTEEGLENLVLPDNSQS